MDSVCLFVHRDISAIGAVRRRFGYQYKNKTLVCYGMRISLEPFLSVLFTYVASLCSPATLRACRRLFVAAFGYICVSVSARAFVASSFCEQNSLHAGYASLLKGQPTVQFSEMRTGLLLGRKSVPITFAPFPLSLLSSSPHRRGSLRGEEEGLPLSKM